MDTDYVLKGWVRPPEYIKIFSDVIHITVPKKDTYTHELLNSNIGLVHTENDVYLNFDKYDYKAKVKTSYSALELHKEFDKMGSTSNTFALLLYPSKTTHSFLD